MGTWAVLSIGCIECGEENTAEDVLVGVFADREKALAKVAEMHPNQSPDWEEWKDTPGWVTRSSSCGGFSTSDWQVRVLEIETAGT